MVHLLHCASFIKEVLPPQQWHISIDWTGNMSRCSGKGKSFHEINHNVSLFHTDGLSQRANGSHSNCLLQVAHLSICLKAVHRPQLECYRIHPRIISWHNLKNLKWQGVIVFKYKITYQKNNRKDHNCKKLYIIILLIKIFLFMIVICLIEFLHDIMMGKDYNTI